MAKKHNDELPEPERLLVEAEKTARKVRVGEYWETVTVLREKGYSWREIAEWLNARGVPVHYKQLERHATKLELEVDDNAEGDDE